MLIIRRIDTRSFMRAALPALLLANAPLVIVTIADQINMYFIHEALSDLEGNATKLVNGALLLLVINLLPVIAGSLLLLWVYKWIVRRGAGLAITLRPVGRSLRLLRIGPTRAWGAGLLLAGVPALLGLALVLLPDNGMLRGHQVFPLLNLNLAFRLLEGSEQTRQYLTFVSYYAYSQTGDSAILQFFLVQGASLVLRATLAGGLLLWLGANLYNRIVGPGGEYALRLRARRMARNRESPGVTARVTGIHLSRTPRIAIALLAALALLLILPVIVLEREVTPVMLLSILRWPLALLLFNRLAPRAGGLIVHGERATPSEGPGGQGTG